YFACLIALKQTLLLVKSERHASLAQRPPNLLRFPISRREDINVAGLYLLCLSPRTEPQTFSFQQQIARLACDLSGQAAPQYRARERLAIFGRDLKQVDRNRCRTIGMFGNGLAAALDR